MTVSTFTEDGKSVDIIVFPQLSATSTELLLKKASVALSNIEVTAVASGACSYQVFAKGLSSGEVDIAAGATFTPSGLTVGGLTTEVDINDASWVALPTTALTDRNALSVQNVSGFEMKVRYTAAGGYNGMVIATGAERHYDITDSITLYGRAISGAGTVSVNVEELA